MKNSQFLSINFNLLSTNKLTSNQKIIISYILSWQEQNKQCTASNEYLSSTLGISLRSMKNEIFKLNKLNFFSSTKISTGTKNGSFFNSKIMKVDEEQLKIFISTKEEKIEQPVLEPSTGQNESITDDSKTFISKEGNDTTNGDIIDSTPIYDFVVEEYISILTKNMTEENKKKVNDSLQWYLPMLNSRSNEPEFCIRYIKGCLINYNFL